MTGLARDLRYALRQFVQEPGFTAVAAITLAPGIGREHGHLQRCCPSLCLVRSQTDW